MKRYLLILFVLTLFPPLVRGQGNQVLNNGANTGAVNFSGCNYTWTNDQPGIGLPASGLGDINAFTAINTGKAPIIATINATSIPVQYAYIPGSNGIAVINTSTNNVITTIPAGYSSANVAATPDETRVYISDPLSNSVLVINTSTNTIMATIPVGNLPGGITVTPDGKTVFVGNYNDNSISVISTATNKVTTVLSGFDRPFQLRTAPVGNLLYVLSQTTGVTWVVNTTNNTIVNTLPFISQPWDIAISSDGTMLYIVGASDNSVHVFNATTYAAITTIPVGLTPENITISPDGKDIYVGCFNADYIADISTSTNTVTKKINMPFAHGLAVSADGKTLFAVDNYIPGSLNAIDIATGNLITAIPTGYGSTAAGNFLAGASCAPVIFTITVNPTPAAGPDITFTAATGTATACAGTASVSPNIQQVAVSGTSLTGVVSLTAPNGFEISFSATTDFGNGLTINPQGGTVRNVIVFVRLAATASVGSNSGNIEGTSPGAKTIEIPVTGTVNALPTVNTVPPQSVTNGTATTAINFTGTGNTFTWTNDTPGIGLAASGTGDIASFTAVNTNSSPVTATVTATASVSGFAYVPNSNDGTLSVITIATNTVVATIALGSNVLPFGVSVSPDGTRVYVTDQSSGNVLVINTATNAVVATIGVGVTPEGISVSPDGSQVYVANQNSNNISVISTATNTVVATFGAGIGPVGILFSPDGSRVYVSHGNTVANTVSVFNTATNALIATIAVGSFSAGLAISPDGSYVYVANQDDNSVSVINTANNTVIATVGVGSTPEGVTISPNGGLVYVSNINSNSISVINTATNRVVATIPGVSKPFGVSVSADGAQLYAANNIGNTVTDINTVTNTVSAIINVGRAPISLGNFINKGPGCSGAPTQFTITVNPVPAIGPDITSTAATGTTSACAGTASVSPDIQQVAVSATSLTGAVSLTAPNGFEISFSATSGFGNNLTITPVGGTVNNVIVYVRLAATASVGSTSGNIEGTSPGAKTIEIPVTGTVNALPTVNVVPNQMYNNGATTNAVNFTGTGNTFTWTNDTPAIGLAVGGIGNIVPFTAVNNGSSPVVATVTVNPQFKVSAYLANEGSTTVSVIDIQTNTVTATIQVGTAPFGVSISPDGSRVYVGNTGSNNVSVINTATNTVIATIEGIAQPFGISVSPDGSKVYVAENSAGTISVIDAATNTVTATIQVGGSPYGITVSPDGSRVYVAELGTNIVSVVNTPTNTVITTIPVGNNPIGVSLSPDGSVLYVTNGFSSSVSVINTATNTVAATIGVGQGPVSVTVGNNGSYAYVVNQQSNNVSVINTATNTVVSTIPVGFLPFGASLSPDGTMLYVTNEASNSVSVINTTTNKVITTLPVGENPDSFGNFIMESTGCAGTPTQFTITVNPTSSQTSGIVVRPVSGSISTCAGIASASPNIQQFTVSGTSLTAPIILTAPNNFEISLSPGSGFTTTITLPLSDASVNNTTIYVRSAATSPAGNISGNVSVNSTGVQTKKAPVNSTVNAPPTVNAVLPQTFINGGTTTAISFTGTGNVFNWTNSTPGIGLPASGTGSVPGFTAVNTTGSPITATITVTPASSGFAYIANYGSNTVSAINTASNSVATTIPVGKNPWGVAVSPDGSKAYVTNQSSNSVSVIDAATEKLTATINVGLSPEGVTVSPDGGTLYVANETSGTISIINTTTYAIVSTVGVGSNPQGIAVSPDGTKVYVANAVSNNISVIGTASNTVIAVIAAGQHPYGVAVSPDGGSLYVTSSSDYTVVVISTVTNMIIWTVPVGASPDGVCISPDGSRVYVSDGNANNIAVINTSNRVVSFINLGTHPEGLSLSDDGSLLYVNNFDAGTVSVINTLTGNMVATIAVGQFPDSIGNFIWQGSGCPGVPTTFTITVEPSLATAAIVASTATGAISACVGTASVSPQLEQFTVSGSKLTGSITAAAPPGFEISLNSGSGFGNSVTVAQAGGNVNNTIVYVRSSSTASPGPISGSVILSSPGAPSEDVAVAGTVNYLPAVDPVNNQTTSNGLLTNAVNFSGTGNLFTWTNDMPAIGLAASGSGNIIPFTAINNGSSPVTATVTVTAASVTYAYVANSISNNVSVINIETNAVIATIPVGNYPCAVAVSPDGSKVYIANQRSNSVSVISTASNSVVGLLSAGSNSPIAIAVSPDGKFIYVLNLNSNSVSVYDTSTFALIASIGVGGYPVGIAITPDGTKVYVTNSSNTISVIDATHNTLKTNITEGNSPNGIVVSPDGTRVYATITGANEVSVISTASDAIVATVPVGANPAGLAMTPDGSAVYVANQTTNNVSVISTSTNEVVATIPVGLAPTGMSVTSDGSEVYAVNQKTNNVSVIGTGSNTVVATVNVGSYPISLGNFINTGTGCSGVPVTFTITVGPTLPTAVSGTGVLTGLTTIYGTPSTSESFSVSGTSLTSGILVTPPVGFELSIDNLNFSGTITIGGGGNVTAQTVYIRLAAITPVGNNYSGNIQISSPGATNFNLPMPLSTVTPALLAIIADDKNKTFNTPNPLFTATFIGFVNNETVVNLATPPILATIAVTNSPIGQYPITVGGAASPNYTINYINGTLTVLPTEQTLVIPNTFTPNGDGINDTWDIKYLDFYANCSVDIFTRWGQKVYSAIGYGVPWDGTYKGKALPTGTYYYVINLKNGFNPLSGFVALIR